MVGHYFHSFDEHTVLLCGGIQDMLEFLLYFVDKNFATVLRAKDDVVRQVEDGSCALNVTASFRLLKFHLIKRPHS